MQQPCLISCYGLEPLQTHSLGLGILWDLRPACQRLGCLEGGCPPSMLFHGDGGPILPVDLNGTSIRVTHSLADVHLAKIPP